jgi:hypothetical protein
VAPEHLVEDVIRKVASVAAVEEQPDRFEGLVVASEIAVIAIGQAAAALSFIVPKKPQASFWVAGMVCWVVIVISWVDRCDTRMNALFD